jgi:hypothetical protein
MVVKKLGFFLLFLLGACSGSFSQVTLDDIDLSQIPQKKVRRFIKDQINSNLHNINEIQPSCTEENDLAMFNANVKSYIVKDTMQTVWKGYQSLFPRLIYSGHKVSFSLLLKKEPDETIFYNTDSVSQVDTGQVYFLNLKILKGIYNLPVVFEIIKIDTARNVIEFSYVKGNKTEGMQQLQFIDMENGNTRIIHTSYFKSNSAFRDKYLYSYFHTRFINDFHHGMKKYLNS